MFMDSFDEILPERIDRQRSPRLLDRHFPLLGQRYLFFLEVFQI